MKISIHNHNKRRAVRTADVRKMAERAVKILNKPGLEELEIVFMTDKAIIPLNRKYKRHEGPTDVLTFNLAMPWVGKGKFYGQLFISTDTAKRHARQFGADMDEEIARYVIHGILHLYGYTDYTPRTKERMWKKQEELMERICTTINSYTA